MLLCAVQVWAMARDIVRSHHAHDNHHHDHHVRQSVVSRGGGAADSGAGANSKDMEAVLTRVSKPPIVIQLLSAFAVCLTAPERVLARVSTASVA